VVLGYPGAVYRAEPGGGQVGADRFNDNPQLVAAQGFAVLAPSLPGGPT
jgi:dipeptidyl aminopeptidase/acylaminoacyl peptidase